MLGNCITQYQKPIKAALNGRRKGGTMDKVKVGDICHKCKYYSSRTWTCDYCNIMRRSRLYTDGVRIDSEYCDKFIEGKREYNAVDWNNGRSNGEPRYYT